ncbi:MAG: hypothetical protein ACI4LH_09850, partial [Candidatus Heritagella sp.]
MKRKIRNCLSLFLVLLFMIISAVPAQAASGTFRYYSITTIPDTSVRLDIMNTFSSMGYSKTSVLYPSPTNLKNGLKTANVAYIHGHGSAGRIRCDSASGSTQGYLYSSYSPASSSNDYLGGLSS